MGFAMLFGCACLKALVYFPCNFARVYCLAIILFLFVLSLNHSSRIARASEHIMRITAAMMCKRPRPVVVPVQNDPSGTKQYIPHCTILHRCGNTTGCCNSEKSTCVAKAQQTVDLYFFVSACGLKRIPIDARSSRIFAILLLFFFSDYRSLAGQHSRREGPFRANDREADVRQSHRMPLRQSASIAR